MDPLSVTASVIAVLQAANCVVSVCYDFRAAIKDQPWALTRLTSSVNELRLILNRLEQVANEAELNIDDSSRMSALEALCQDGGVIANCHEDLRALEQKLGSSWVGKESSKRKALIQSIGWQFRGKDAEDMLKRLEGYKSILNLAISVDQSFLIKAINKTMKDVDENTKSMFRQFEDMSTSDRKRKILQWLSPVDPSLSHKAASKVRQAGTNDWFLSCKEFEKWLDADESSLWLSGFPGSGKTVLISSVIEFLKQRSDQKEAAVVAYFYCDFRSPETRDPLNLAGSLLAQICFQIRHYPAALEDAFERSEMSGSPYGKRTDLDTIVEIIIELASEYRLMLLVDGLDECGGQNDVLKFLKRLGGSGSHLNLLVSSRDEIDIRGMLSEFSRMRLESSSVSLDSDIDCYISYRLEHDSDFAWLKPSFKQTIHERLSTQAKGMFRWVQCQLDQIEKLKTMRDIREALNHLPTGLQETYENILGRVHPHNVRIVRQTLQWLVCNVWPMTLEELHECLAIEPEMDHIDEEAQLSSPEDIYDLCRSLIAVTSEGDVILAHLSVKDYLLSDAIKRGAAAVFALSEPEANAENALKCLTYLSFREFRHGPAQSAHRFEDRLLSYPFLDHASRWWVSYAENSGSSNTELRTRVLEFFTPACRPQFMSWLQIICSQVIITRQDMKRIVIEKRKGWYNEYPQHATPLYYAASFGIEHVVRELLAQGVEVDATGGRLGATAFHAAALRGHVKVMDLLYRNGADPNKKDFISKTPLDSAALVGNVDVIKYLLDHGVNPKNRDSSGRTASELARRLHHDEAAKLLEGFPD